MNKIYSVSIVALSTLFLCVATAYSADDAGRIMFVAGKATIVDAAGQERLAKKGAVLKQGDRLVTSDKGMIQVKMRDDGIMAVRPNTDLKLNNMLPQSRNSELPSQALLLSRGGVRVLTGDDRNKMGYLIKTAATSLGLRDGDTEALVIPALTPAGGRANAEATPAGTYNRINAGSGIIQGVGGNGLMLATNQISFTPSATSQPVLVGSLPTSYVSTTVPLQVASIATIAPTSAATLSTLVPGGTVLAPLTTTPIAATPIAPTTVATITTLPPTTVSGISTAPALFTGVGVVPVPVAPIAIITPLPPPVMVAPPVFNINPILVVQPILPPPPPPPPVYRICLIGKVC